MKRESLILVLLLVLPGLANALGLGELELISGLNQPLEARIRLLSPTRDDLDSLRVKLADIDAFRRAGIDRPLFLAKLKFQIDETSNGDYINVSSNEVVREPYLNFLLEAEWSRGRLFREYTVLLDPPLYDPSIRRGQMAASTKPEVSSIPAPSSPPKSNEIFGTQGEPPAVKPEPIARTEVEADDSITEQEREQEIETEPAVIEAEEREVSESAPVFQPHSGNEYGPAKYGDTLWSVARDWRPDSTVTIQQMMLALLRTNPEAFIDNNINGLKRGHILRMPDSDELTALTNAQALNEVKSQYAIWDEARGNIAASTSERPLSTDMESGAVTGAEEMATEEDQSELRLVAATETGTTADLGGATETGADAARVSEGLALANEQLEAISQENIELKERLTEAESIIEDLKRLVVLKDDELASIQQQMEAAGEEEQAGVVETEAGVDEAAEEVPATTDESTGESEAESVEQPAETAPPTTEGEKNPTDDSVKKVPAQAPVEEQSLAFMGILDQVIATIMENLVIIGGALGAVLIAVISLRVISRRKGAGAGTAEIADLPDFSGDEGVTGVAADAGLEDLLSPGAGTGSEPETDFAIAGVDDTAQLDMAEPMFAREEMQVEEHEDPLAEVNVFLAYEHFEQAEEFVRGAIKGDPDNLDYHSKLLEVFYAAGNKSAYEEAARVLHDKVNGAGEHWDMALAMWQEMSPNRALFETGVGEGEEDVAEGGVGMLDITAVSGSESGDTHSGLDFDLGEDEESASTVSAATSSRGDLLDITAGGNDEILDVTTATDEGSTANDLLDVTAAVGLDTIESVQGFSMTDQEQQLLEMTSGGAGDVLESSLGGGEDLLDITAHANLEGEGIDEDLLDVTAATSVGADVDGLMDLNMDIDEGVAKNNIYENSVEFDLGSMDEASADDNVIDFDTLSPSLDETEDAGLDFNLNGDGLGVEEEGAELDLSINFGDDEGDALEFSLDSSDIDDATDYGEQTLVLDKSLDSLQSGQEEEPQDKGDTLQLDMSGDSLDLEQEEDGLDSGLEIDLSIDDYAGDSVEEEVLSFSMDDMEDDSSEEEALSLNMDDMEDDSSEEEVLSFSMDDMEDDIDDDSGVNFDLTLTGDDIDDAAMEKTVEVSSDEIEAALEDTQGGDEEGIDLDALELTLDAEDAEDAEDLDMDNTFQMTRLDADMEGDDEEDQTVFVPSSSDSQDDEIATKLDLAKAYVELGDNDSAKAILDEVITDGNDEQRQQAQALMGEI